MTERELGATKRAAKEQELVEGHLFLQRLVRTKYEYHGDPNEGLVLPVACRILG
jgi:hypothetical protein